MEPILAEGKFKTGDSHPTCNQLAFVGYCDDGHPIWTSVFGDPDAPYRLAKLNGQCLPCCRREPFRILGTEAPLDQNEVRLQSAPPALLDKVLQAQ